MAGGAGAAATARMRSRTSLARGCPTAHRPQHGAVVPQVAYGGAERPGVFLPQRHHTGEYRHPEALQ